MSAPVELNYDPAVFPHVRTDLECAECGEAGVTSPMVFRPVSKYGAFYGCSRWPACSSTHGAHDKGTDKAGAPLGVPATAAVKKARIAAHDVFDRLWKGQSAKMKRGEAYAWMREAMGMTKDEAHIGNFGEAECARLVELVNQKLGAA